MITQLFLDKMEAGFKYTQPAIQETIYIQNKALYACRIGAVMLECGYERKYSHSINPQFVLECTGTDMMNTLIPWPEELHVDHDSDLATVVTGCYDFKSFSREQIFEHLKKVYEAQS